MSLLDQIKELDTRFLSAAANGMVSALQGAIVGGADKNAVNEKGQTALHLAACGNHTDAVRYLCETAQLDMEARDKDGNTPLLSAFEFGRGDVADYLMERKVDVTARDNAGKGIVWKASENRSAFGERLMKAAIAAGAEVDEVATNGQTPCHQMVMRNNITGLEVALLAGANPNLKGIGMTMSPVEVAKADNLRDMTMMLQPFAMLPQPPLMMQSLTTEGLLNPNAEGKRLIDNPMIWRRMPEVLEVLAAKGEPMPAKEDLLRGGVMGYPPLALAAFSRNFAAAQFMMEKHGQQLEADDFWNHDRSDIGMFGKAAVDTGVLQGEFSEARATAKGAAGTKALYQGLPEAAKDAVPNFRQLMLRLQQQEQSTGRGR